MSMPLYKTHNGRPSSIPATREEALTAGEARHLRPAKDPICNSTAHITAKCLCPGVYTETGECITCTAKKLWNAAMANTSAYPLDLTKAQALDVDYVIDSRPCPNGPHLMATPIVKGKKGCAVCAINKRIAKQIAKTTRTASPRQNARSRGEAKYMPDQPCVRCGITALKAVHDGTCDGCVPPKLAQRSPRQAALSKGEAKYMPDKPCTKCGTTSLKGVNNGACDGCTPPKRSAGISANTRAVMDAMPADYLVDKDTAKQMGLTAYRDGEYCRKGHTGWTYIVGGCVTCGGEL